MQVAILGAGTGGLAAAIALAADGHQITIYERNQSASTMGAGIVLWPNAVHILKLLDILPAIVKKAGQPQRMLRTTANGELLGCLEIEDINQAMQAKSYSILRDDFQEVLLEKIHSLNISIQYLHNAISIEKNNNSQQIIFDNQQNVSADIIIGADGRMHSIAREYVYGSYLPTYQHFINWVGVFKSDKDFIAEMDIQDIWGVGKRFGIVPINKQCVYWAAGIYQTEIGKNNYEDYQTELSEYFSGWPAVVEKIIKQTNYQQVNKIYVHDHQPIEVWHRDNVVLLGDAAHAALPTSGQGACLALEDAYQLASCLQDSGDDFETGFKKYTAKRYQKTKQITVAARNFAENVFNNDIAYCQHRDQLSRQVDYKKMALAMAELWSLDNDMSSSD